jgi:hypothetical protein
MVGYTDRARAIAAGWAGTTLAFQQPRRIGERHGIVAGIRVAVEALWIGEVVAAQVEVRALPATQIGGVLAELGVFGVVFQIALQLRKVVLVAVVAARRVTVAPGQISNGDGRRPVVVGTHPLRT